MREENEISDRCDVFDFNSIDIKFHPTDYNYKLSRILVICFSRGSTKRNEKKILKSHKISIVRWLLKTELCHHGTAHATEFLSSFFGFGSVGVSVGWCHQPNGKWYRWKYFIYSGARLVFVHAPRSNRPNVVCFFSFFFFLIVPNKLIFNFYRRNSK